LLQYEASAEITLKKVSPKTLRTGSDANGSRSRVGLAQEIANTTTPVCMPGWWVSVMD
jgi:hypothetical protein